MEIFVQLENIKDKRIAHDAVSFQHKFKYPMTGENTPKKKKKILTLFSENSFKCRNIR